MCITYPYQCYIYTLVLFFSCLHSVLCRSVTRPYIQINDTFEKCIDRGWLFLCYRICRIILFESNKRKLAVDEHAA